MPIRHNDILFEKYTSEVNTKKILNELTLKFGKYTPIKDENDVKEYTYNDALRRKIISTPTQKNLADFTDVGFVFDKVYVVGTYKSPSILVFGKDPDGQEVMFVRKGGSNTSGPKIYYHREFGNAIDYYRKFEDRAPVPPEVEFIKGMTQGRVTVNPDGSYDINGNISVNPSVRIGIRDVKLPADFKPRINVVRGSFTYTASLPLESMPRKIYGDLTIYGESKLTSLSQIPTVIAARALKTKTTEGLGISDKPTIRISGCNNLKDLTGFPQIEGVANIDISSCENLVSLEGLPESVSGLELTDLPKITSLKGAPKLITDSGKYGMALHLNDLPSLTSLAGLPEITKGDITISNLKCPVRGEIRSRGTKFINLSNLGIASLERVFDNINFIAGATISLTYCGGLITLKGLPEKSYSLYLRSLNFLPDLIGMPRTLTGDLVISQCPNLKSLGGVSDKILGNVTFAEPAITEIEMAAVGLGDIVSGRILTQDPNHHWNNLEVDKIKVSKKVRDELELRNKETGINLDI